MKTTTTPHDATLRFWMVRIPEEFKGAERTEKAKAITRAGFSLNRASGFKARIAAVGLASRIEKATGIEMEICKHDYL